MPDPLAEMLCWLGIGLFFITLIGHGIWLVLAAIAKALFGDHSSPAIAKRCPRCGRQSLLGGQCNYCGSVPMVSIEHRMRDDLLATARQLARLQRTGHLPYDQCVALLKVIESDLARFGMTLPPEVWRNLDLKAQPAERAVESVAEVAAGALPAEATKDAPLDASVIEAVVIDEPVAGDLAAKAISIQPAPLTPAHSDSPFAPALRQTSEPAPQDSAPLKLPPMPEFTSSRTLADMLQGFMEESNIRWGEVIAGLVIVISAIGLVVSLRATLQHIPYFPALLFMLFTVSFHGAGLYTLRRWKLAAVSRAILIIALLLVPLSFAAGVVLSGPGEAQRPLRDPLFLTAMVVGLGVFGWVSYSGSKELTGEGALRLTTAILGCCFAQVVINRGAASGMSRPAITSLALLPVAAYLIAAIGQIFRAQAWQRMSSRRIEQTFLILGVSSFALLPPLALLILKVEPRWPTFVQLAPLLSLVATSVLTLGLVVHRRALAKQLAALRTSGTAIALIGGALLIFLGVVVWPRPELMLNLSLLTGALLLAIAIRTGMPALHAAATSVLAVAVFVGFVWWQQLVRSDTAAGLHWLQAALRGQTSLLLTLLAAVIGACGGWFFVKRNQRIGLAYFLTAGVMSVLSLLIAGWSGFVPLAEPWTGDGDLTGPLFLCYGIALLTIAIAVTSEGILAAGMALLWIALVQLLDANETARSLLAGLQILPERPVLVATILEGVILSIIALVLSKPNQKTVAEFFWNPQRGDERPNWLIVPLTYGAAIAIVSATPFVLWVVPGRFGVHALYATLAALVWGIVCVARRWPAALAALQAMVAVATAFAIAAVWSPAQEDQFWFARGGHLQAQLLALAASAGVWSVVRRFAREGTVLHDLLHPKFPACDHVLLGVGVTLLTILSISSALQGFAWELGLGTEKLTVEQIPWLDQAHGWRLAWGVVAIGGALLVALVDRITGLKAVGLGITGWAAIFLIAQIWQAEVATASAARWLFVIYGSLLMLLFVLRSYLQTGLKSQAWLRWQPLEPQVREWFRFQPLLLGVLPMLALTIVAVAQNASGVSLRGPLDESIFMRFGTTVLYAGPMLIGVTIFLGLALGQRQSAFALGGGLLFQLAANLAFILHISGQAASQESVRWAECLQWNTIAAATYALIWFALAQWLLPKDPRLGPVRLKHDTCFVAHLGVSAWLLFSVAIWAAGGIIRFPDTLASESRFLGHWSNAIAAMILAAPLLVALGVSRARRTWAVGASAIVLMLAAVMPILAIQAEALRPGIWAAFHVLEIGWLVVAAIVAGVYALQERNATTAVVNPEHRTSRGYAPHHALAAGLCGLLAFMAIRGNLSDPAQPFFSAGVLAGVCAVLILLGTARRSQPYAFASLVAAPLAAALPWFTSASLVWWNSLGSLGLPIALNGCLLAAILIGGWWQALEIRMQLRLAQTFSPRWFGPLAGHVAIVVVTLLLALAAVTHLLVSGHDWYVNSIQQLDWGLIALATTWLALGLVNIGSLWDRRAIFIFPALLAWLWIGCALGLAPLRLSPLPMLCLHALATAAVFALAGHLWSFGANLAAWGEKLGVSDTIGGLTRIDRWLPTVTVVFAIAVCGLELGGMWNLKFREQRVAIALAPALFGYALACLAQQKRQSAYQLGALLLGGLSCVYLGWSDLDPGWKLDDWMTRAFRLLMVLAVVTFGYGLVLPRLLFHAASWLRASHLAGYVSSLLAIATLVCLLAMEIALFEPGIGAGVDGVQVAAVAVLLVLFIVGLISLAIAPGAVSPSEQFRRTWFVYGAQVVMGLLFAHLYLCKPDWFDGILRPYWPYLVMAIAFAGVGLSELFWRLRLPVLAEPFQRTGAFLPVLPILGLLIQQSKNDHNYALLLFSAGLMYLILSFVRKSWAAAIAAAVAGNGALWALLDQSDWNIIQHPQFWLIPPAVSVLAAAHINRHRLKPEVLSAIRYASLIVIYVSSTFEIFLHRAETSLWPPVILALLSLSGALAGVLLQIRAFLYLGAVFTLLAMVSMVWHAARAIEHVWPWWAFGIGMGIAILGLLAFFEKNRSQVQALVQRLRKWDQ